MTRIVDFIFLIFAAFLGKKALLLSVFAFAPSVLANDIPLATLSVDNIQVRAEWDVVGDDANYFSVEGGTLMLRPVTWTGYPERSSNTITAIVEVRDKFSTLNPNYEDLITRIKITTVIMGCYAYWTGRFAKSRNQELAGFANRIIMEDGPIKSGDVIARRNNDNGYNNIFLHTVTVTGTGIRIKDGKTYNHSYMTTSPDLFEYLKWDTGYAAIYLGWADLEVNESETCFAEEIETFQQHEKTQYLNANAPLVSGYQARRVTVDTAFALTVSQSQHFYLYDVKLGGLLPRPNFIIDNGKAFRIDNSYPIDNSRYEYVANLTVASDGYWNNDPHEVIFLYQDCPTVYEFVGIVPGGSQHIEVINTSWGERHKVNGKLGRINNDGPRRVGSTRYFTATKFIVEFTHWRPPSVNYERTWQLRFADHFLCEGYS